MTVKYLDWSLITEEKQIKTSQCIYGASMMTQIMIDCIRKT